MRRVLYISGTRADFGLMEVALRKIHHHPNLSLGIIVTGMHLLREYGETWREIESLGVDIVEKVPVSLSGSSNLEMSCALGEKIIAFSRILAREMPDMLLVLGDRGEMLAGAIAAAHLNIPIVHLHGGERSGTIDEPIRHAISKFAHYHLVSSENSRERLVRMGERSENIGVTGAPGLDSIIHLKPSEKISLFDRYSLDPDRPLVMVLFHPVIQQVESVSLQVNNLLSAVFDLDMPVLILMPNSDAGGCLIKDGILNWENHPNLKTAIHVPRNDFLSLLMYAEMLVGNSSSGIIEAASLSTPVLNVGIRQNLRERNPNVIDVGTDRVAIREGLGRVMALRGEKWSNVYGNGTAANKIVQFLNEIQINSSVLDKVNTY